MEEFFNNCKNEFEFAVSAREYSPLTLAYIGDAVFEMCVRTMIISKANAPVNVLNKRARGFVNAGMQAKMFEKIKGFLTEEEFSVMKRGRNAKSFTSAKNATISDYRHATGLEALFGYLYIKNDVKRLLEIFNMCVEDENEK